MDDSARDICVQWKLFPNKVLISSESSLKENTSAVDDITVLQLIDINDVNQAEARSNVGDDTLGEEETNALFVKPYHDEVLSEKEGDVDTVSVANCRSSHSMLLTVPMYDDENVPLFNQKLILKPPPRKWNVIYFIRDGLRLVKATLISNELNKYYYNIQYEDGSEGDLYLKPNERWLLCGNNGTPFNQIFRLEDSNGKE